jgi:hypothetical protein
MTSNLASAAVVLVTLGGVLAAGCSPARYSARALEAAQGPGVHAVAVVRVAPPWYAPRFVIRGKFRDALPEYEAIPPLEAKYFTIADDGRYGGIYLWATRGDAERHFDAAWHAEVRERRGVDGDVLLADAPYVVNGPALPRGEPIGARSEEFPACASLVRWELAESTRVPAAARRLAQASWARPELVRAFVITGATWVGIAAIWATREAAERAASEDTRASLGAVIDARSSEAVLFEAPLLIDATLRGGG